MEPQYSRYPDLATLRAMRRRRHPWLKMLFVLAIIVVAVNVGPTPWAVHMGGRWTPTERWRGFGPIRASNGGRYLLMTDLHGGIMIPGKRRIGLSCSQFGGCDDLYGTGTLCTESGLSYTFELRGQVHAWWTTDGARVNFDLTHGTPVSLSSGWVVAFHGAWDGSILHLHSPDNSFTEAFTPAGLIRHVTSTADAGTAELTLQPGTSAEFEQACRALAAQKA